MLLDTSGLLCLHHRDEPGHVDAAVLFEAAVQKLTHNYILAEFVALAHARRLPRRAALSFVADVLATPEIEMIWVDEQRHRAALAFLQARLDKSYSLCDALSILLMDERSITEALTTDHHFEQAGFRALLR